MSDSVANAIARMLPEMRRRIETFSEAVAFWADRIKTNQDGLGIHKTQFAAAGILFSERQTLHQELLTALETGPAGPPDSETFAQRWQELDGELCGSHGLLAVFRFALEQRANTDYYRRALDAADLFVADCYKGCMDRARALGLIAADHLREPPLTCLNTLRSAAAFSRDDVFGQIRLPADELPEQTLPVPIVSLPIHHTATLWEYCSLYHEVGHPIDAELGLQAKVRTEALDPILQTSGLSAPHQKMFRDGAGEMIADAFGVLLGETAYVECLAELLFVPNSLARALSLSGTTHPPAYVRLFLATAMLREATQGDVGAVTRAQELEAMWMERYGPPDGLSALVEACPKVAQALLMTPLTFTDVNGQVARHPLTAFAGLSADDRQNVDRMARFLRSGTGMTEDERKKFPYRLIPAAAQVARRAITTNIDTAYADLQRRALAAVEAVKRPQFLAPAEDAASPAAREPHLRQLSRSLRLYSSGS